MLAVSSELKHMAVREDSLHPTLHPTQRAARGAQFLAMLAVSSEFENMAVREDELPELDALARDCPHDARGGPENKHGKVNILLQAYVSRARMESFSLTADMMYVSQNAPRICRALFEICLRRSWSAVAELALTLCKARPARPAGGACGRSGRRARRAGGRMPASAVVGAAGPVRARTEALQAAICEQGRAGRRACTRARTLRQRVRAARRAGVRAPPVAAPARAAAVRARAGA